MKYLSHFCLLLAVLSLTDVSHAQKAELVAQVGHANVVGGLRFNSDGKILASVGWDKTIKIWDVTSGKLIRTFAAHSYNITIALSANGKILTSGSDDGTIRIWHVASSKLLYTLVGHSERIMSLALSTDGRILASGSYDKTIKIWSVNSGKLLRTFPEQFHVVNVALNSAGTILASGTSGMSDTSPGNRVKVWETFSGKLLHTLLEYGGFVHGVVLNANGKTLATRTRRRSGYRVRVWDTTSGKLRRTFFGRSDFVTNLSLSANGKTLASGSGDDTIGVWDTTSGNLLHTFRGYPDAIIVGVSLSADGKRLAACTLKGAIEVWDVSTGKFLHTLSGHSSGTTNISLSTDGKTLASGSFDKTVKIWDTTSGRLLHTLSGHSDDVSSISLSADGKTLASSSDYKTIKLRDVISGKLLHTFLGHSELIRSIVLNADGKTLASGGFDKTVKIWDTTSGRLLHTLSGHSDSITSISLSADGKALASGSSDESIKLWNAASGQFIRILRGHTGMITSVVWSPDNKSLVSTSEDSSIRFWRTSDGKLLLTLYAFASNDYVVLDPEGRFDGTENGLKQLHYVVGLEPIELDQLKQRYYTPGLWERTMNPGVGPLRTVQKFNQVGLYPEIEKVYPPAPGKTRMTVVLRKRSGGYGRLELKVQNSVLKDDARPRGFDEKAATQRVAIDLAGAGLEPGKPAQVEVLAWNKDGDIRSRSFKISYTPPGSKIRSKPCFYAIVVGTGRFASPNLKLRFAAKDAIDFARALELAAHPRLFASREIRLLTTADNDPKKQPTRTNILHAFKAVRGKAKPADVVVIYFSGHGVGLRCDNRDFYCYLTCDAVDASEQALKDRDTLNKDTIHTGDLDTWLTGAERIKAQKRVLILDTCAAGAYAREQDVKPLPQQKDINTDIVRALDRLNERTGYHVLMGCAASAKSYEANRYSQGLLTFSLLNYMKYDGVRDGSKIEIRKLFDFAEDKVPELARQNHVYQQPRAMQGSGHGFPIGLLEDAARRGIRVASARPVLLRPNLHGRFTDNLRLSAAVQEALEKVCNDDTDGPVFIGVGTGEYVDGTEPAGNYRVENGQIILDLILVQNGRESVPVTLTASIVPEKRAEFVDTIIETILELQRTQPPPQPINSVP